MSRWLRFYTDAMRHPKVARLSDREFRLWVRLLVVAAENDGSIPAIGDLKHVLNSRLDHLSAGIEALLRAGLIERKEAAYEPHNWSKHQYKSDTSTDRVRNHRGKRNVSETLPEADTEADTENRVEPSPPARPAAEKNPKTKKGSRIPDDWMPDHEAAAEIGIAADRVSGIAAKFRDYWSAKPGKDGVKLDWLATWRNWCRSEVDRGSPQSRFPSPIAGTVPAAASGPRRDGRFYALRETPQFSAWDRHLRANGRPGPATDQQGGWLFASEWPPGFSPPLASANVQPGAML